MQASSDKSYLYILLPITALGALGDGTTTMFTLLSLFPGNNILIYIFAVLGAIFITLLTANHRIMQNSDVPFLIKLMWLIAFLADLYTAYIGTSYYVVMGMPLGSSIDFSQITCCDFSNLGPTILGFSICFMLSISSLTCIPIYEKIRK